VTRPPAGRWLAPEAARAALTAAGSLGRRAIDRFARLDAVAEVSGAVVAVEVLAPPAVARPTVRLHAVDATLLARAEVLRQATELARSLAPEARVQLRSAADQPDAVLPAAGYAPFTAWIRKRPQAAPEVPGAQVRYADGDGDGDWDFVAQCHRTALRSGMPTMVFAPEVLDSYVHDALRIRRRGRPEALVCRVDGERSGHVTWRTVTDRWSGSALIDVVDVFVTPAYLRGPTGAALNVALEREVLARRPGMDLLGNVVAEDGAERRVLERLAVHGWWLDHMLWQLA